MKELSNIQTSQLARLLAEETINYYKLIGYGASIEECNHCNNRIKQIEVELDSRRNPGDQGILNRQLTTAATEYSY